MEQLPEEPLAAIMPRICVDKPERITAGKKREWITNALFGSFPLGRGQSGGRHLAVEVVTGALPSW